MNKHGMTRLLISLIVCFNLISSFNAASQSYTSKEVNYLRKLCKKVLVIVSYGDYNFSNLGSPANFFTALTDSLQKVPLVNEIDRSASATTSTYWFNYRLKLDTSYMPSQHNARVQEINIQPKLCYSISNTVLSYERCNPILKQQIGILLDTRKKKYRKMHAPPFYWAESGKNGDDTFAIFWIFFGE